MSASKRSPALVGIEVRHKLACASSSASACSCDPSYRGQVHNPQTGKPLKSRWFRALADAKSWRIRTQAAIQDGTFRNASRVTVEEACKSFIEMAASGALPNKSGTRYKPSVLRGYDASLRLHVLPTIGSRKLTQVRRPELQHLIDRLSLTLSPSTVDNAIMPLRAVYRRACLLEAVAVNPTLGLVIPSVVGKRDRVASPSEAAKLLRVLADEDQPLWAVAMYAGLRLGELKALDWIDVDLQGAFIRVEHGWDPKTGQIPPKSLAGRRTVAIPEVLRPYLESQRIRAGDRSGLVFGRSETQPFSDSGHRTRAKRVWIKAGLTPLGFHEARHTYASLMIASGVNAKTLSTMMGHSSITVTLDRYGHLFPGAEAEAAAKLDAYLQTA